MYVAQCALGNGFLVGCCGPGCGLGVVGFGAGGFFGEAGKGGGAATGLFMCSLCDTNVPTECL